MGLEVDVDRPVDIGIGHVENHHGIGAIAQFMMTHDHTEALDQALVKPARQPLHHLALAHADALAEALERTRHQFQPGLLLDYALQPNAEKPVVDALAALTASLEKPTAGAAAKAIEQLEAALIAAQPQIAAHLQMRSRK